ncbi:HD domain-containing phosphohydrolase [Thermotalea metallivorans]|uniref:Cyclic di-GMP phosphodiesterase response regulator RpfG n=1 Tax=Thermotalea metallivorans TaxID=520762 RepID=A0A140LAV3_9FIRM|nr:HD domain-containing phosphohydrolase [Thermotalea metallivorans]KXG77678.1 Cyclic di-GMP phosphodiesterase response regulator RpfG [Thermotalea metallivorans]
MFKRNFRVRLMAIFLIITLIPLLFMGIAMHYSLHRYLLDLYNQDIIHRLSNEIDTANQWFQDRIQILKIIRQGVQLFENQSIRLEQMNKYLAKQRENTPEFFNIFFTLEDGTSSAALESKPGIDFRQRPWYIQAKEKGGLVISEPYDDIITGEKVITISLPMWDAEGRLMGVIGGDLALESIRAIIRQINIAGKSQHFVFSEYNKILWADASEEKLLGAASTDLERLRNNPGTFAFIDRDGKSMMATYMKMPATGWQILIYSDTEDYYLYADKIRHIFYGIATVAITLMLISVFVASKQIAQPMIELRDAVREVSLGRFDIHIQRQYHDEIGEVVSAFNQMAATIRRNYQSLTEQARRLMEGNRQLQDMNIELELSYEQLQDMNMELEASYEQLQATMEQLNYSEQKYRLLMENITDLVWVINGEGRITYINDILETMLGYKTEEVMGQPIQTILCPMHRYEGCEDIIGEFQKKDFNHLDLWMLAKGGQNRLIIETSTRKIYQDGRFVGVQGIGRDVTEYVKMKQEIIRKNKELTVLSELSYSLTSTISNIKIDVLLKNIVNKIVELMDDVALCTIRLLENEKELVLKASAGSLEHLITRDAIHIDRDGMGIAVKEKRLVILNDLDGKYISPYNKQILDTGRVNHVVLVPLKIEENVIGVMAVSSETKIEDSHIHILNSLSNHAAVAIEKARLYGELKQAYFKTIKALVVAVEAKDSYTQGHSVRVSQYASLIGKYLNLTENSIDAIQVAGILHDIGKIGISEAVLTKPGPLSEEEYNHIMQHPTIGSKILDPIGLSREIMEAVLFHHKRYDLDGYPGDAEIEALPLYAEIIGVADAFDAMLSRRSYRKPMSIEEGIEELKRCSGTQFSPKIVEIMEKIYKTNRKALRDIAKMETERAVI